MFYSLTMALTILCWIHSWCEYISSPPKSIVTCDRSTCANKSSNDEHTIRRNLNSSLKNFELTSDMAFWKNPLGRITYTTCMIPGKYDCKLKWIHWKFGSLSVIYLNFRFSLTEILKSTALTAVHRSLRRSMIKLNPKSASCKLKIRDKKLN